MTDDLVTVDPDTVLPIGEVALRAGDLHGEIMRQLSPLAALPVEELMERGRADLIRLRDRGLLTDEETEQLREVLQEVGAESTPAQRRDRVHGIVERIKGATAGPVALTIATIAADSSRGHADRVAAAALPHTASAGVVAADVVGGIGGVFIGDELCGLVCGVMGGVAGASGLSMLAQGG